MIHEHEDAVAEATSAAGLGDDPEMSPLGNQLMEIRKKYIAEGGKLLAREELEQDLAERRGGVYARGSGSLWR